MKRITTHLAVGVAMALGASSVAVAADASLYGSIRSGIIHDKADGSKGTWNLGTADAGDLGSGDKLWSRIGVRVSHDLGNGMTGGAHLEKRLDNWRTRHQNVYLEGGLGRVTMGQQGLPFYGAVAWDGVNFTGGFADPGSRGRGVKFGSNLGGPFNFSAMLRDGNSAGGSEDMVDEYQVTGTYDAGIATISLGYLGQDDDGPYSVGGAIGGDAGGLSWKAGYHSHENNRNVYGLHLGYGVGGGNAYVQYEDCNVDDQAAVLHGDAPAVGDQPVRDDFETDHDFDHAVEDWEDERAAFATWNAGTAVCGSNGFVDDTAVILGYAYVVGPQTRIIAEHRNMKEGADKSILGLRVDF